MIAERTGDPLAFVERTISGEVGYDSHEWTAAFQTIADLRTSGALLDGSGATDYATMQLLFLQGKAAMTYNGTWLLGALQKGTPTVPFDLHVAPLPLVDVTSTGRSILAWGGLALPTKAAASRESAEAFLEYASRPEVDQAVVEGLQVYSPIAESNVGIHDAVAREFLPMFENATQLAVGTGDGRPGPGPRERRYRPSIGREGHRGGGPGPAGVGSRLLPLTDEAVAIEALRYREA